MMNDVNRSYRRRTECRICGRDGLRVFLSLGPMPLANSFPRSAAEFATESSYPLDVAFCEDCSLVQTPDVIDPEVLFRDYIYVSGTSDSLRRHWGNYAAHVVDLLGLGTGDLVAEVASNDGSLLRCFQARGVRVLGIEPATNIAAIATAAGVETVNEFFNDEVAERVRREHGPAAVVVANNVFAHVDDTLDFLRGCKRLIADNGLVVIEAPYLGDLLDGLEYDTIYHEHLCYFSVTALLRACDEVGLSLVRIDRHPVHGGSLRMHAGPPERWGGHDAGVIAMADRERADGIPTLERYQQFAAGVEANRTALNALLDDLLRSGKSVAAYGAPAKGNTLLNYCGIGPDRVPFTVDMNPMKVGRYTPGTHLPVCEVALLLEQQPDYLLILAWNFAREIMAAQSEYRNRGGRFIIPVPRPQVV